MQLCPARRWAAFPRGSLNSPRLTLAKNHTGRVRICVVFNPVAKGNKARRFMAQLGEIGRHAVLKMTRGPGDARILASQAVQEGFDCVAAAGGDGTLNEVLNGLGDAADGFERSVLGVLPLGTVNVFARELGIPLKLSAAWQLILGGREKRIDLGRAEYGTGAVRNQSYFAQLAGAGLDARSIELVNWKLKKCVGPLSYVYAGLKAMAERKPMIRVVGPDESIKGELVLVGNGRLYGGNFRAFEQAEMTDGLLDVCVFPRVSYITLLRCAVPLLAAGRLPSGSVRRFQAKEFRLSSEMPASFELEGELAGALPVTFSVAPRRLRVIVP